MTPQLALRQVLGCLSLGVLAGIGWTVLHPLSRTAKCLRQVVFCLLTGALWLQAVFGVCRADPRLSVLGGAAAGFVLWLLTGHRLLHSLFTRFWCAFARLLRRFRDAFHHIFPKIEFFIKFLFPSWRK